MKTLLLAVQIATLIAWGVLGVWSLFVPIMSLHYFEGMVFLALIIFYCEVGE